MTWLALETSGDRASVAVGPPGSILAEEGVDGVRRHAAALPDLIARVLSDAGVGLGDLSAVLVADGPGSFTGLRVGVTVAKALVRSQGVAFRAMPALAAVAWAARPAPAERVLAVTNALRGEVYAAEYRFPDGEVEVLQLPTVRTPEWLLSDCPVPDVLAGTLPPGLAERLAEWSGGHHPRVVPAVASAGGMLALAARRGAATSIPEVSGWEPTYGRPAEAQAKWEREHGRRLPDSPGHYR